MAVRIGFGTEIKAPVLRKRSTQNDKHSWSACHGCLRGTAYVSSTPQDRFCDPDTATLGIHKFIRLLGCTSAETGLQDLRLTNGSHIVLIVKEWK